MKTKKPCGHRYTKWLFVTSASPLYATVARIRKCWKCLEVFYEKRVST